VLRFSPDGLPCRENFSSTVLPPSLSPTSVPRGNEETTAVPWRFFEPLIMVSARCLTAPGFSPDHRIRRVRHGRRSVPHPFPSHALGGILSISHAILPVSDAPKNAVLLTEKEWNGRGERFVRG